MANEGFRTQSTSHNGFFATLGTPTIKDSETTGVYYVWPAWFVADAQINAFYAFMESQTVPVITAVLGGWTVYHNRTSQDWYFYAGIMQLVALFGYMIKNALQMAYHVINATYLQSRS